MLKKAKRSKFALKALGALPAPMRYPLIRSMIRLDYDWPRELEIGIAANAADLSASHRLLHDAYVEAGLIAPHASGMRVLLQHALPQTSVIVAKWKDEVVGTASLIRDNPAGLPMESHFDLSRHRSGGRRLAEMSSLAVVPEHRRRSNRVLFPLFRYVYQYARERFGVRRLMIAVEPRWADMYRALMLFRKLDARARVYETLGHGRSVRALGLYQDFESLDENAARVYARAPRTKDLWTYFREPQTDANARLPRRAAPHIDDPVITPELLDSLYLRQADLAGRLNDDEFQILMAAYPQETYQRMFALHRPHLGVTLRKDLSVETDMPALIGPRRDLARIWRASKLQLTIRCAADVRVGSRTTVFAESGRDSIELIAEVQWARDGFAGLRVIESNRGWRRLCENLEAPYRSLAG